MQFSEGQVVTCAINGVGVVTRIEDTDFYPVTVQFLDKNLSPFTEDYSTDGKLNTNDYCAVLFPGDCDIEITARKKKPLKYGDVVRFKFKSDTHYCLHRIGVVQFCDYSRALDDFKITTAKIEQDGCIDHEEFYEFNYNDCEWQVLK